MGLKENNIEYLDIDILIERNEQPPYWISIPTLSPELPKQEDLKIISKIAQFKPHYILLLQYAGLRFLLDNGEELRRILGTGGKVGFWLVDLAERIYENKTLGRYIDFLFLSNEEQLEEYKEKWNLQNVVFMPQGCYLANTFNTKKQFKYNIVFLGRRQRQDPRYNERNALLDFFRNSIGLVEFDNVFKPSDIISLYQQSKIILGTSWRNDVYLYSSDRIFNVLGAGSFYLCSYFPGIETLFENHKHLVWFKNQEESLKLAKYYLQHNQEREKIAYNGYMLVKQKHTYKERIKNISDIFSNKTDQFYGYLYS